MNLISNTPQVEYNVSAYAGGEIQLSWTNMYHYNTTYAADKTFTLLFFFQDINGRPAGTVVSTQDGDLLLSNSNYTTYFNGSYYNPGAYYNMVKIRETDSTMTPEFGGIGGGNINIPVPNNAFKMYWIIWSNAGSREAVNNYWDSFPGEKFITVSKTSSTVTSSINYDYLGYVYALKTYVDTRDGQTIAVAEGSRIDTDGDANITPEEQWTSLNGVITEKMSVDTFENSVALTLSGTKQWEIIDPVVYGQVATNQGPVANVGSDVNVSGATSVTLDASTSYDPDGDNLTFQWYQVLGPVLSINYDNTATADVFVPAVSHLETNSVVYKFVVKVSDGINPDVYSTAITVTADPAENRAPITVASTNYSVTGGTTSIITDSNTYDPDGDALTYSSTQVLGPTVTMLDSTARDLQITFPTIPYGDPNVAIIDTVVSDGLLTATRRYLFTIATEANQQPVSMPVSNKVEYNPEETIRLYGHNSYDPEGGGLTYLWTISDSSTGILPVFEDTGLVTSTISSPTIVAPVLVEGDADITYRVVLKVTDEGGLESSDDIIITIKAPVAIPPIPGCTRCNISYSIDPVATQLTEVPGTATPEAKTYDLYTGQIMNDGTSEISTYTYTVDGGVSYDTGYLGDNNIIYASKVQVPARTIYDLETYGYAYQLQTPVATVDSNESQFVVIE